MSIEPPKSTEARPSAIWTKAMIAIFVAFAGVGTIAWVGLIGWWGLSLFGY